MKIKKTIVLFVMIMSMILCLSTHISGKAAAKEKTQNLEAYIEFVQTYFDGFLNKEKFDISKPDSKNDWIKHESKEIAIDAMQYLTYIGKNLKDRSAVNHDGGKKKDGQHDKAFNWIRSELKKAGIRKDQIMVDKFVFQLASNRPHVTGKNMVITMNGERKDKQVVVGAHYDGDGVGDNGSGTALLMSMIKHMQQVKLPVTIKYIFFDTEEEGMLGSGAFVSMMSQMERDNTLFMVNMDSVVFGDYCNVYGGKQDDEKKRVTQLQGYYLAVNKAKELGMKAYLPKDLDGYYKVHKRGPKIEDNTIYTNPWTFHNGPPVKKGVEVAISPSERDVSDHAFFKECDIPYIKFTANNRYCKGDGGIDSYTGYYETKNDKIGYHGMFMNTEYDTLENLEKYFPGRAEKHFKLYGALLTKILMEPNLGPDKPSTY